MGKFSLEKRGIFISLLPSEILDIDHMKLLASIDKMIIKLQLAGSSSIKNKTTNTMTRILCALYTLAGKQQQSCLTAP